MKVVFLRDVENVAEAGEVKEVRRGYARNFLLPRNIAVPATKNELNRIAALQRAAVVQREREEAQRQAWSQELEGVGITLLQRAGPMGRLYGSVTNATIAEALSEQLGHRLDKRAVELPSPIRETGEYEVPVRLGPEHRVTVKVNVTTAELQRQRERARARAEAEAQAQAEAAEAEAEAEIEAELLAEAGQQADAGPEDAAVESGEEQASEAPAQEQAPEERA